MNTVEEEELQVLEEEFEEYLRESGQKEVLAALQEYIDRHRDAFISIGYQLEQSDEYHRRGYGRVSGGYRTC